MKNIVNYQCLVISIKYELVISVQALLETIAVSKRILSIVDAVEPGSPDVRGDILGALSSAEMNLARLEMERGEVQRQQFLARVKRAMIIGQESIRCVYT